MSLSDYQGISKTKHCLGVCGSVEPEIDNPLNLRIDTYLRSPKQGPPMGDFVCQISYASSKYS